MTKTCKRAAALLLAVCLMLPMTVPPVWAADTEQTEAAATVTVDYDLYYSGLSFGSTGATLDSSNANNKNPGILAEQYGTGTNFMLVGYDNTVSSKTPYINSTENSSVNEKNRHLNGLLFYSCLGDWIAFKIKSPGEGSFDVSLNYLYKSSNTDGCAVYLWRDDTSADEISKEEISNKLSSETLLNTANLGVSSTPAVAALGNQVGGKEFSFEKDKDYIVVFKAEKDNAGSTTGTGDARMHIVGLTMTQSGSLSTELANISGASTKFHSVTLNASDSLSADADISNAAITVSEGAELDLNGNNLSAKSVTCFGTGVVKDSKDGEGALAVTTDGDLKTEDQLPLKDADSNYRFFDTTIQTLGITGTEKNKFWFRVSFENQEAYALAASQMTIGAGLTATEITTETAAWAGEEFTEKWVTAVNDSTASDICFTARNFRSLTNFKLTPMVKANGVSVSGAAL